MGRRWVYYRLQEGSRTVTVHVNVHGPRACTCRAHTRRAHSNAQPSSWLRDAYGDRIEYDIRMAEHSQSHQGGGDFHGIVPHSVEEAEQLYGRIPAGWDNAPLIRPASSVTPEDAALLADAIYAYMRTKDIAHPAPSWQDFVIRKLLQNWKVRNEVAKRVEQGETPGLALLHYYYPKSREILPVTDQDILDATKKLEAGRPSYEHVTYEEVIEELAKTVSHDTGRTVNIEIIVKEERDVSGDIAQAVKRTLDKHKQKVWITFLSGLLIGLITNGIYDLLKMALESLVGRAPYSEAQIYEIECDLVKELDRWMECLPIEHELDDDDIFVALTYTLHVLCILAVVGPALPSNPLIRAT